MDEICSCNEAEQIEAAKQRLVVEGLLRERAEDGESGWNERKYAE